MFLGHALDHFEMVSIYFGTFFTRSRANEEQSLDNSTLPWVAIFEIDWHFTLWILEMVFAAISLVLAHLLVAYLSYKVPSLLRQIVDDIRPTNFSIDFHGSGMAASDLPLLHPRTGYNSSLHCYGN